MFHLFTHAFFKALLFLGAGSVIHAMHDEQDMRKMGGLVQRHPGPWLVMLIGTLALTGFGFPARRSALPASFPRTRSSRPLSRPAPPPGMIAFILTVIAALSDLDLFVAAHVHDVPRQAPHERARAARGA